MSEFRPLTDAEVAEFDTSVLEDLDIFCLCGEMTYPGDPARWCPQCGRSYRIVVYVKERDR